MKTNLLKLALSFCLGTVTVQGKTVLQDCSFDLNQGKGPGSCQLFTVAPQGERASQIDWANFDFKAKRQDNKLHMSSGPESYTLTGIPQALLELDGLKTNGLISETSKEFTRVEFDKIQGLDKENKITVNINKGELFCETLPTDDQQDAFCLRDGKVNVDLVEIINAKDPDEVKVQYLENIDFEVEGSKYKLIVKTSAAPVKIRIMGTLNYEKETGLLKIKVEKARASMLPIKAVFLKLLASTKSPILKIEGDQVILNIGKKDS